MNILVIGMQRSGTTLLRRLCLVHPKVRKMFHEHFILKKCTSVKDIEKYIKKYGINSKKHIWGEKCPYYPNIRKIKPENYCERLYELYPDKLKVIHIIRHPLDIANSNVKKFKNINNVTAPLNIYKRTIPRIITNLSKFPYVIQIKYEDLLQEPDIVLQKIYRFCNLEEHIDFRKLLKKHFVDSRYQSLDSSRAFAFMETEQKLKIDFDDVFDITDKIEGPKYKI